MRERGHVREIAVDSWGSGDSGNDQEGKQIDLGRVFAFARRGGGNDFHGDTGRVSAFGQRRARHLHVEHSGRGGASGNRRANRIDEADSAGTLERDLGRG